MKILIAEAVISYSLHRNSIEELDIVYSYSANVTVVMETFYIFDN
jgi:hypothetical protein